MFNNLQQCVIHVPTVLIFISVTNSNDANIVGTFHTVTHYDITNTTTTETNVTLNNIITTTTNVTSVPMPLLSFLSLKSPTNKLVIINMQLSSS